MAVPSASAFASFDINSSTNIPDISAYLSEALLLDFNFMGRGINVAMDEPVEDTTFNWNEEALNSDQVTTSASVASNATSFSVSSGQGVRIHIGDYLRPVTSASTETLQVSDLSTDTVTVSRSINSTTAQSLASGATLVVEPVYNESSDFSADKSVKPVNRQNFTQIAFGGDLFISRSQLKRKMATNALSIDRQLANRAKELKRSWTSISIYGEKSSSAGSDTVLRSTLGLRGWIRDNSGVTNNTSEALSMTNLNSTNKSVVDKGAYVDTLLVGTDLIGSINAIDASNRAMKESESKVGYQVIQITLGQGNTVDVVVDGRIGAGDAFLYNKDELKWRPLVESAMFTIEATDFTDGFKRRIGSEAGIECRHPEAKVYMSAKT